MGETWKGGIIMETGKIDKTLSINSKEMKSLKRIMEIMFQNTNFQKEKDPILFDFQIEINSNFLTSNPSCKKEYYDILAKAKTTFNPKQTPQIKTIIGKHHGHKFKLILFYNERFGYRVMKDDCITLHIVYKAPSRKNEKYVEEVTLFYDREASMYKIQGSLLCVKEMVYRVEY